MKKKVFVIITVILVLLLSVSYAAAVIVYNSYMNQRYETYEPTMFHLSDFDGLKCEEIRFPSDKGQMLMGYLYRCEDEPKGMIIMAHGYGGGGHNSYMDCAYYFVTHGYDVFAFDATGNDKSEGKYTGGMPQGVIDLDHAISFVESSEELKDLPVVLFGHSWGGYSDCAVLNCHPEVKAVVEVSGMNRSSDLIEYQGQMIVGKAIYLMMPFIKLHESVRYGRYAAYTALSGFEKSNAAVMIVHSEDDDIVPIGYGYDLYFSRYGNDPRFTFVRFKDRGHDNILVDENNTYVDDFNEEYHKWRDALDYDYKADENKERFAKDKAEYIHQHLDRHEWANRLDTELFDTFVRFYDEHIND